MLVDGKWVENWQPVQSKDEQGRFVRQVSSFRHWVTPDGSAGPTGEAGFKAESGRYRLYVAYICPWASRTLMARALKGLEQHVPITVVNPTITDQGWQFGDYAQADQDPLFNSSYMHEIYTRADAHFTGRATVPVLWDTHTNTIVNNESADIVRMFNTGFGDLANNDYDLYPAELAEQIDELNPRLYHQLNNGVYKSGFASTQLAYDEAVQGVFAMLDELEQRLDGDFLFGKQLTETDIRAFVTLIRFDSAYHGIFKTNWKRIADYPKLSAYMEKIYQLPGIAQTVNMDHITRGYYSIKALNPLGIRPIGPEHITRLLKSVRA